MSPQLHGAIIRETGAMCGRSAKKSFLWMEL